MLGENVLNSEMEKGKVQKSVWRTQPTKVATTIIAILWNQLVLATTTAAAAAATHDDGEVKWVSHMCDISETALAIRNTKSVRRRPKKKKTKPKTASALVKFYWQMCSLSLYPSVVHSLVLVSLLFASFALITFSHFPILCSRSHSRFVRTNK